MLTDEEKERERILNKELKSFSFSLDTKIKDIPDCKNELEQEKIKLLNKVQPDKWDNTLKIFLSDLLYEVNNQAKYDTPKQIIALCYQLVNEKQPKTGEDYKLSSLQLFLYEPYDQYPPKMLPHDHIKLCLEAASRGVGLAKFIPELQAEIDKQHSKLNDLTNDELKKIFIVSKFDPFRKLEQLLFDRNHIDEGRKWLDNPLKLVALILILKDTNNRYFKSTVNDKQIKDFFQELYQIDIKQQWEPARRKKISASDKRYFQDRVDSINT